MAEHEPSTPDRTEGRSAKRLRVARERRLFLMSQSIFWPAEGDVQSLAEVIVGGWGLSWSASLRLARVVLQHQHLAKREREHEATLAHVPPPMPGHTR